MQDLSYLSVRQKFLDHMEKYGHKIIPSAPLVPEDNSSLLFVNSGMFPLVPYLKGEDHPQGTRIADVQRCIRTVDIDDVGDDTHATAFEMIGNWSLNDYFKEQAIEQIFKFYVDELGIDPNKLFVSVWEGDENAPKDEVSIEAWKNIYQQYGITAEVGPRERIQLYGKSENWWELPGDGPCGPCSEIFYDTGKEVPEEENFIASDAGRYVEIGNNVFMEFLKQNGQLTPLGRHNVDFGGGLDRIVAVFQGVSSFYQTDIYKPIYDKVASLAKQPNETSIRIIVDHVKAATWIIADGILPSNKEQGYILRRILRKSIRHGKLLGIEGNFMGEIARIAIEQFSPVHPGLQADPEYVIKAIIDEEEKFNRTIEGGIREFERLFNKKGTLDAEDGFFLYETYGFPFELTSELAKEKGLELDSKIFEEAFKKHQERSRQTSAGMFKGGLADDSEMSTKYHTATHLLHAALRKILGEHVYQMGSNITPERLRFDFPAEQKLTVEQIKQVEDLVNEKIKAGLRVRWDQASKEEALKIVPNAAFGERYADEVKLCYIENDSELFSVEICGGPHVENTSELGTFKIVKQENVSAGVKRIKAILEN